MLLMLRLRGGGSLWRRFEERAAEVLVLLELVLCMGLADALGGHEHRRGAQQLVRGLLRTCSNR